MSLFRYKMLAAVVASMSLLSCTVGCGSSATVSTNMTCATCSFNSSATLVSFTSTPIQAMPTRANYSGINSQLFDSGTSFRDKNMQALAQTLDLSWVRFPAGTADDPYNWQTGDTPTAWISQFSSYNGYPTMQNDASIIRGKGGIFSVITLRCCRHSLPGQRVLRILRRPMESAWSTHSRILQLSAAALVQAAVAQGATIDVWELANEPVYFSGFYPKAANYLDDVKPFAAAIKAAVPSAKVAVWVDPQSSTWTKDTAAYAQPFWDEIYTHSYPDASSYSSTTAGQIAYYNGFLLNNTNALVENTYVPLFGSNMQIEWSEFNMNTMGGQLYNAVFISEFLLRLASDPHVTRAGMHVLVGTQGQPGPAIGSTNDHAADCKTAYAGGKVIDTTTLDFGYFLRPVGYALQVINGPMNTSSGVLPTSVSNSPAVNYVSGSTQGTMAAIYAQAFSGVSGSRHMLMTNKSGSAVTVQIEENGALVITALTTRSIGGSDPAATNTATANVVTLTPGTAQGTVTVPPYGVMDVAWND